MDLRGPKGPYFWEILHKIKFFMEFLTEQAPNS